MNTETLSAILKMSQVQTPYLWRVLQAPDHSYQIDLTFDRIDKGSPEFIRVTTARKTQKIYKSLESAMNDIAKIDSCPMVQFFFTY